MSPREMDPGRPHEPAEGDLAQLSKTFSRFASLECRDLSPSYECWANHIASDRDLREIASTGRRPIPNLMLAAVHFLVQSHPRAELGRYFGTVNPTPLSAEAGWPQFREFCLAHRHEIVDIMQSRITQTNEVRRSAYLAAAFHTVWRLNGKIPLAVIEIGTAAGLNLCFDHYAFTVNGHLVGRTDSPLVLDIDAKGSIAPPIPSFPLPVERRIGIDLQPISADDVPGCAWLDALVWPEEKDRRVALHSALHIAAKVPHQLIAADAAEILDDVFSQISTGATLCVFQTHCFNQMTLAAREQVMGSIRNQSQQRPVFFVSRHERLTLEVFGRDDLQSKFVLADTDPHGRWIEWLALL